MENLRRPTYCKSLIQVSLLLVMCSGMLVNAQNFTKYCDPNHLPCEECEMSPHEGSTRGGPAICTCESTGYQGIKYCYTQKPTWGDSQIYKECKWGSGRPLPNNTRSDTMVSPRGCDLGLFAFCPQEGPMSGGTDVMIWGHGFAEDAEDMDVNFTGFTCKIIFSNSTFIHCLTASAHGTNARGSFLRLRIKLLKTRCQLEERSAFTYQHDPVIANMAPLKSFLGGGTNITVTGQHFNVIAKVLMKIKAIFNGGSITSASECKKMNDTLVICPAPRITLTAELLENATSHNSRRRREVAPLLHTSYYRRWRRQVVPSSGGGLLEAPGLTVYAGLKMDGLVSGQLYSVWQVYENPIVEEFPDLFKNYRPAWPDFDKIINVYGSNLLSGVTAADYTVTIGDMPCEHLVFSTSSIECTPPEKPPAPPPGGLHKNGDPAMVVRVGNLEYVVGYVHYDLASWNNTKVRYAIIGVLSAGIPILVCIIVLIAVRCYYRRKQKRAASGVNDDFFQTKPSPINGIGDVVPEKNDFIIGDYLHPRANLLQAVSSELRTQVQACLIHGGRVDKTHIKARGATSGDHGAIYRGWLLDEKGSRMMAADIKTFKHDNVPFRDLQTFLQDAVKLRGFSHDNVQHLLGIAVGTNIPQVVCPSSEYGDLKSFLYTQRQHQDGIEELTLSQMVKLGEHIASGMTYLSDNGFVHEDLAARNCVVDKDLVVKVADAALSRDIYELDYWRPGEKLPLRPVKWMAPESLDNKFFSVKSDVWSFGVTLWEIFTLGVTPYTDIANADIRDHLKAGHRLSKPDTMPVSLYTEVTHCWAKEPNKRPNFQAFHTHLQHFGSSSNGGYLNNGYSTSFNNAINDIAIRGAHPSRTSAELISVYIEEGTQQRLSTEDDNQKNQLGKPDEIGQDRSETGSESHGTAGSEIAMSNAQSNANSVDVDSDTREPYHPEDTRQADGFEETLF